MIFIDSPSLPANAQKNAIHQKGDEENEAKQNTHQSQSSTQDSQIVSGDTSILSGNNIQCNNQINSKTTSGISDSICAIGGLNISDPTQIDRYNKF